MALPKLVIFDCDGVLVDTERPTNSVIVSNLSRYGLHLTLEECLNLFVGGTIANIAEKVRAMGYPLPENWVEEMYEEMFARLRQGVDTVPGVLDVLDRLDDVGVPHCLGSNGPMAKMEITLTSSGLWQRLEGRIFSAHVIGLEHAKPAPGLFLHACDAMGVAPEHTIVVEDSHSGATAAKAAGMRCFGYCAETPREQLIEAGATPFDRMAELSGLLGMEPH